MLATKINTQGVFADATTVKAYKANQVVDQRRAPIGASVAEGETANGAVTLSLEEGQAYKVGAEVNSKWVWINVTAQTGASDGYAEVVAANTITLPSGSVIKVTGNTEIKKIEPGRAGKRVTLVFGGTPKVVDGENLKLAANFEATADDTLTLVCDGTNWFAAGSSVN